MTLDKQFKLTADEKPKASLPSHQRRQKFIAAIDKHLAGLPDDGAGSPSLKSSWVWQSDKGDWFISPRYGKAALALAPGMTAIKCENAGAIILH